MDQDSLQLWIARLKYQAELSARYHEKRGRFFGFIHLMIEMVVIVFGSIAFLTLFFNIPGAGEGVPPLQGFAKYYGIAGGFVAVAALVDRALHLGQNEVINKSATRDFHRVFSELNSRVLTEQDCEKLQGEIENISVFEFTARRPVLEALSHNEIVQRTGLGDDKLIEITNFHLFFAYFINPNSSHFKPKKELEASDEDVKKFVERMGGSTVR